MRTSFSKPEDASDYSYEEFPKPETDVTEYTGMEGVQDFQLKGLGGEAETYMPSAVEAPVVKPAVFQDFKEVLPS